MTRKKFFTQADLDDAELANCQKQLQELNMENQRLRDALQQKWDEVGMLKQRLEKLQEKVSGKIIIFFARKYL